MVTQFQAMDLPRQIEEKTPYEIRALFCHGINARMFPNSGRLFKALNSVDFCEYRFIYDRYIKICRYTFTCMYII